MGKREHLVLVLPSAELERAYQECEDDFQRAGETFLEAAQRDYGRFVQSSARDHRGMPGKVPQTDYFLVRRVRDETTILGRSALRHHLTAALRDVGGHIGYRVRPSERRRGYGTQILAMTLLEAWKRGLDAVLLTCDSDNIASRRIIERNGGHLWSEGPAADGRGQVARYWIHRSPVSVAPPDNMVHPAQ